MAALGFVALGLTARITVAQPDERDLATYAGIDDRLEWEYLIAPDATWFYFLGREEPGPKLEWTGRDFGDGNWLRGPAPFGFGEGDYNTSVAEMLEEGLTTMYLRHTLTIFDPGIYRWVRFEIAVDDGYVCYLNKLDEGRASAGPKADIPMDFDATASSQRTLDRVPRAGIDFTDKIKVGENIVAIQGLNFAGEETFGVAPQMRGWFAVDPERDRARFLEIQALLVGEENTARRAYLEGAFLQRIGQPADAIPFFAEAAELDPMAAEPWARLLACHREAETVAALEASLRAEIRNGTRTPLLLDTWARALLEDLGHTPVELLEVVPADETFAPGTFFADAHFAGCAFQTDAGQMLSIDCGSASDRFFSAGRAETLNGDASSTVRVAARELATLAPIYSIALPPGPYALQVDLVAGDPFELVVEGARIPCTAGPTELPVFVADGFLELEALPGARDDLPAFEAIEAASMEAAAFLTSVEELAAATKRLDPYILRQLAEAKFAAGETRTAVLTLEEAARLPRFSYDASQRLDVMRDALLPDVASIDSAHDLLARRADEAASILAGFQAVAADDEALAIATYMEGRMLQLAGHFDEAVGFYEELVFGGAPYPEPYVGMAECLRSVQLPEEASNILRAALDHGVPASEDLLHLLLAMQVDDLKVDVWDMVAELRELDLPDTLTVIPTSRYGAQSWQYSIKEPPSTTWSRDSFDASTWTWGLGGLGSGSPMQALIRTLWYETVTVFSRQPVHLRSRPVLYPYYLTYADGASDIYLNGTLSRRIPDQTYGYITLGVRDGKFSHGDNILGIYGVNSRDQGFIDAGVIEPLGELEWILTTLETDGAIRINCAGGEYTDQQGRHWTHDRMYSGYGWPLELDGGPPAIAGTDDPGLYQSQQLYTKVLDENDNWYQVPVPNGNYTVTLHFAEIDPEITAAGQRIFAVKLEKKDVIAEYDIFASAGFATADVHTFEVDVTDGWMDIDLTRLLIKEDGRGGVEKHKGDPVIAAIEIVRN